MNSVTVLIGIRVPQQPTLPTTSRLDLVLLLIANLGMWLMLVADIIGLFLFRQLGLVIARQSLTPVQQEVVPSALWLIVALALALIGLRYSSLPYVMAWIRSLFFVILLAFPWPLLEYTHVIPFHWPEWIILFVRFLSFASAVTLAMWILRDMTTKQTVTRGIFRYALGGALLQLAGMIVCLVGLTILSIAFTNVAPWPQWVEVAMTIFWWGHWLVGICLFVSFWIALTAMLVLQCILAMQGRSQPGATP